MSFTNENLKQLKKTIGDGYGWWHEAMKTKDIQALIARLEAAEAYIETSKDDCGCHFCEKAIEAWLKSKGG